MQSENPLISDYLNFLNQKGFPCVAAKAAITRGQIRCMVSGNMACPADDQKILEFLYNFVVITESRKFHFTVRQSFLKEEE